MSAFVCSAKHIGTIARQMSDRKLIGNLAAGDFAEDMARLNVESVDYRYNETTDLQELNIFVAECRAATENPEKIGDERLLGAVGCFLYQSCESDACEASETYQTILKFENILDEKGIKSEGWSL